MSERGLLFLARHGETEWSLSGQHTGTTDIPLTPNGEEQARALAPAFAELTLERVLVSPRQRARRTAELIGVVERAEIVDDLVEWDYGDYDGLTTPEIHERRPGWLLWRDGAPNGESPEQMTARLERLLERIEPTVAGGGNVALVAHGHILRAFTTAWLGLPLEAGRALTLGTATLSVLGGPAGAGVLRSWNLPG